MGMCTVCLAAVAIVLGRCEFTASERSREPCGRLVFGGSHTGLPGLSPAFVSEWYCFVYESIAEFCIARAYLVFDSISKKNNKSAEMAENSEKRGAYIL